MSLINDALKRTAGAQKQENQGKQYIPSLQPVGRLKNPIAFYIIVSIGLLVLSVTFAAMWLIERSTNKEKNTMVQIGRKSQVVVNESSNSDNAKSALNLCGYVVPTMKNPAVNSNLLPENQQFNQELSRTVTVKIAQFPSQNSRSIGVNIGVEPVSELKSNSPSLAIDNIIEKKEQNILDKNSSTNTQRVADTIGENNEMVAIQTNASVIQDIKPVFPQIKLNGIFYRASNPSAIINGKLVYKNDIIYGAKVISIEKIM
jgi:hypothetical protein